MTKQKEKTPQTLCLQCYKAILRCFSIQLLTGIGHLILKAKNLTNRAFQKFVVNFVVKIYKIILLLFIAFLNAVRVSDTQ